MNRVTNEQLAVMMKNGFDDMDQRFLTISKDITWLKQGQEDILLKLDQHAYKMDVKELEKRVDKIERKIGI